VFELEILVDRSILFSLLTLSLRIERPEIYRESDKNLK